MREKRSLFSHLQRQKICNKLAVYEVRDQLCVQAVWPQQAQGAFESLHGGGGGHGGGKGELAGLQRRHRRPATI